ncbi:ATP-binding protein [Streptomyces sp. B-S-A8]|uniref:ATP-binding protein n=1 Tax=Streptomyces solicavernae TaxID=3043614 RepID=A0ABT6RYD8_9ACTN|nr:ATP-binding protein [Streptomyces sp. B-S-A8]MDI3389451.1 ATP-binding protein [Streptomyces sp. B-S-A8]
MHSRTHDESTTREPNQNQEHLSPAAENCRHFSRRKANVPAARRYVADALTRWDHVQRLDDIRLCVSEMVTNALLHAPVADGLILVRLELHSLHVLIEVQDSGDGTPAQGPARQTDGGGRGLFLVDALADDWGVTARQGPGKRVWATFRHSPGDDDPTRARSADPERSRALDD